MPGRKRITIAQICGSTYGGQWCTMQRAMNITRTIFLTLAAAAATCFCSCQNHDPYPVLFLTEADSNVQGAKLTVYYNGKYYNRLPILSHKNFGKFRSFLNPEDGSYGVRLYTKPEYANRLYITTLENQGRLILPVVGGLAYQPMLIDKGISDGELDIRGGLNGYDLKMMSQDIEPAEPEMEKKRFLSENPRPLPMIDNKKQHNMKDRSGRVFAELPSYRD